MYVNERKREGGGEGERNYYLRLRELSYAHFKSKLLDGPPLVY